MSIQQFTRFGYSFSFSQSISTTYNTSGFAITADVNNSPASLAVPDNCYLESIEFQASDVAAGENLTIYLARDSAGAVPITTDQLAGATQAPTLRTGTTGGYVFTVNKDYHFDSGVSNTSSGTLYLFAKTSTGSITSNVRLNWRA